ncbi:restriction endonuclease subunit S, partial [Amaricoccus solimangrovi]
MSWPMVALHELAEIERRAVEPRDIRTGTTYVGLEHIGSWGAFFAPITVSAGELASNKFRFDSETILYGKLRPYLAKIVAPDRSGVCSTDILPIRPGKRVDRMFLLHYLRSPAQVAEAANKSTGINLPRLPPSELATTEIPLPPLAEQRRIAGILDAADALRRRRREALALLDALPGAIFAEMFGDPVERSRDREFVPLGEITSKVGSGATPRGGATVYREKGTKFIRSMNVRDGIFSEEGMVCIDDAAARQLSNVEVTENDVFLNITGASVARCCRSDDSLSGARVNQHVAIIRPSNAIFTDFIMGALCHPHMNANLLRIAEAGATRQAITKSEIERLEVPAPSEHEAEEYSRRLRAGLETLRAVPIPCEAPGQDADMGDEYPRLG